MHRDIEGGGWLKLRRGQVTDDTEMSLALGRAILAEGRVDPPTIAETFSAWMSAKPVDIGHTVRRGIARYRQTGEAQVPPHDYDAGNGACMRCLPVALLTLGAAPEAVDAANLAQAHVTHHSALADAGTLTVIRMVQTALAGGSLADLQSLTEALVADWPEYRFDRRRTDNPGGYLPETLSAVFQALFSTDGFETALVEVVNRGGDADTSGAVLGMIAGALYGRSAIPRRWLPEPRPGGGTPVRAPSPGSDRKIASLPRPIIRGSPLPIWIDTAALSLPGLPTGPMPATEASAHCARPGTMRTRWGSRR